MSGLGQHWQDFMARRHPPARQSLTLIHKRIYILPTRPGLGLALLLLILLIGAINYQLSLGFFLVFLLAGIAFSALLRTYAALLGLTIGTRPATTVFAGEMARFPLWLSDGSGRNRPGITLISPQGNSGCADVNAHSGAPLELLVPAHRRGRLTMPRSRIECRTPSGWFVAWSYLTLVGSCVVYLPFE